MVEGYYTLVVIVKVCIRMWRERKEGKINEVMLVQVLNVVLRHGVWCVLSVDCYACCYSMFVYLNGVCVCWSVLCVCVLSVWLSG